jgi:NAD(P)-dependent dehydrogenase (short-subunit alcohol dehydrogenase family)
MVEPVADAVALSSCGRRGGSRPEWCTRVYLLSMSNGSSSNASGGKGFSTVELAERRAIVTGGASGIGRATAIAMAEAGANVVVTDIDEAGGANVAAEIGGSFAMLDVSDPAAWARVVSTAGPFDIAFLNAGISTNQGLPPTEGDPLTPLTDEAYRRIMSINLDGVVFGARAVLPAMLERGSGDIVATASIAGVYPIGMDPIYGLTKHGVVGFVRSLARYLAEAPDAPDVCVSALCPGFTDTNIIGGGIREMLELFEVPIMPVDHVAGVVLRALQERVQGAQWAVEHGFEPYVWDWPMPKSMPAQAET